MTPIEKYKNVLLKRLDKFVIDKVNGGKVVQAEYLIKNNLQLIKTKHNNSVVCYCSIKSPQSAIIATICKKYDIECNILTYKSLKPNINLSIAQQNGANIFGFKVAYNNVLESYAKQYFKNSFLINMGFEDEQVVDAMVDEVENITNVDYLVVPVGSAMNFLGILKGVEKYNKQIKHIIGVYVGKNPIPTINKYYKGNLKYTIIKYDAQYTKSVNIDNYFFDPIYEAKAYKWLIDNIDVKLNKCLFWVIGKRNMDKNLIEEIKFKEVRI